KNGLKKAQAKHGSILVMDPQTGQVLAMANWPSYNPAEYNKVKDYSVFQNKTVSEPYEPGSVIKTLTMGAGLNEGVITPNSTYDNTGSVQVDDVVIHNALASAS